MQTPGNCIEGVDNMLCRNDGKCFTLNPYYREVYYTKKSRKRRFYFKHGVLEVKLVLEIRKEVQDENEKNFHVRIADGWLSDSMLADYTKEKYE